MQDLYTNYYDQIGTTEEVKTGAQTVDDFFRDIRKDLENKVGNRIYILVNPLYDRFRSDPRFDELLQWMGLDKYK